MKIENIIKKASEELKDEEAIISFEEYLELLEDNKLMEASSAEYLLEAIKYSGKRKVIENGEELERYRFFDDPYNDGENAILGNTEVLNEFVDSIKYMAKMDNKEIIWINGPTATGKSEFKRCLINGLKGFSRTEKGKRYTIEMNVSKHKTSHDMLSKDKWYQSPVRSTPISILPERTRQEFENKLNLKSNDIDPFCQESLDYLKDEYKGKNDPFDKITSEKHLRLKRFTYDIGNGIGLLTSEDEGSVRQKLIGHWMKSLIKKVSKKGQRNPQAFSYSGILSQGNNGVSIVEDASMHSDILQSLMNILDENRVKISQRQSFDLDTVFIIISNPDLEESLDKKQDLRQKDPLKALKRRMKKIDFKYLTNHSLEENLLYKEITGKYDTEYKDITSHKIKISENNNREKVVEITPHAISIASLYNIVTRLDSKNINSPFDLIDKAKVLDKGSVYIENEEYNLDDVLRNKDSIDGEKGIPVTYTKNILSELIVDPPVRYIGSQKIDNVVTSFDLIEKMKNDLEDTSMFNKQEIKEYEEVFDLIEEEAYEKHEKDMISSIIGENTVDKEEISEYVNNVYNEYDYNKNNDDSIGEDDIDHLFMKVFEIEKLGKFSEANYDKNHKCKEEVEKFRYEEIINSVNNLIWSKKEGYEMEDLDFEEIPIFERLLSDYTWDDVKREYEEFDIEKWENPTKNTQTKELKEKAIQNMIDKYNYSKESAEIITKQVLERGDIEWE